MIDKEASKASRIRHYKNYEMYRNKRNIKTNAVIAKKAGICPSAFTDWKNGVYEPKMEKILTISRLLRVSPYKIFD